METINNFLFVLDINKEDLQTAINSCLKEDTFPAIVGNVDEYTAVGYYSSSGSPSCWTEYYQIDGSIQEVIDYLRNIRINQMGYNMFIPTNSNSYTQNMDCYIVINEKE